MDQNEFPLEPHLLGVPSGASKTISKPMVLWRKPCTCLALTLMLSPNSPKWDSTRPTSPRSFIGCVQNDSEPMVSSVQTTHLSYVKISTISKRTEMSFLLGLITSEYHQVHLKWFLCLWYVRRKMCTYLAARLALSPNGPKWASTWASSSSNSIGCIQNNFRPDGTFGANHAPILHWH
jgi:hypothetical protein